MYIDLYVCFIWLYSILYDTIVCTHNSKNLTQLVYYGILFPCLHTFPTEVPLNTLKELNTYSYFFISHSLLYISFPKD